MGSIGFSRNVGNYQSTLLNIPEDRISHLHRAGTLKSRCRSVAWQQLCMSNACKFIQLLAFNFTHTYCVCVYARWQKGTNCQQVDISTRWQKTTQLSLPSLQIPHGLVYRLNVAELLVLLLD